LTIYINSVMIEKITRRGKSWEKRYHFL
jgi:hypothetical protein